LKTIIASLKSCFSHNKYFCFQFKDNSKLGLHYLFE